tara:strand:- start:1671 stop:2378 length:708 start_codon:yes stop_codon:yes gene_type:complete
MAHDARLFYSDEAVSFGVNEATLLNYLRLFIIGNKSKGAHIDDEGKTWTYTTYIAIAEAHPYWSVPQVGRFVRKLRDAGVILTEKRGYDSNTWFAFVDEEAQLNRSRVRTKSSAQKNETVESTYILKNTKEILNGKKGGDVTEEMIEDYFTVEKHLSSVQAKSEAESCFIWHDERGNFKDGKYKSFANTWYKNAVGRGRITPQGEGKTREEIANPDTGLIDTSRWELRGIRYYRR